jgi:hypothetical protein
MSAFTWQLWLAIVCTMLGFGVVLWGVETCAWHNRPSKDNRPEGLPRHIWMSLGRPMQARQRGRSLGSAHVLALVCCQERHVSLFVPSPLLFMQTADMTATSTAGNLLIIAFAAQMLILVRGHG